MSREVVSDDRWGMLQRALDREFVCDRLNSCINWPNGTRVAVVGIGRFMPGRRGRFDIEYDLLLEGESNGCEHPQRTALYARLAESGDDPGSSMDESVTPKIEPGDLSGIRMFADDLGMALSTPDCDAVLSQYGRCMDGPWMTERLTNLGLISRNTATAESGAPEHLQCTRVAFRAGRRFVVRYTHPSDRSPRLQWAGKCYADDRGERLMEIHRLLYEQLTSITQGRVGLPRLIHYDGDLRMLLSVWTDPPLEGTVIRPDDLARSAAETLLAIQATSVPGLKLVDSFKRRQVLERWHCRHLG